MARFEIEDLSFSYASAGGKLSLDRVSFSVAQGEYLVLCGRSGSGKTTLLKQLKPVLAPAGKKSGRVLFGGTDVRELSERDQAAKIGYVMQNPDDQIVTDKVWHELAFGLESLGCDQKTMRARVAEMACYFGIQDWFHRDVVNLSGGQKQLLNLASLILGQNGIWGDRLSLSDEGIDYFAQVLTVYKRLRDAITEAYPRVTGQPGQAFEAHEKLREADGQGVVVLFANQAGDYEYRLHGRAAARETVFGEATVQRRGDQVRLHARFDRPGAVIAFFEG